MATLYPQVREVTRIIGEVQSLLETYSDGSAGGQLYTQVDLPALTAKLDAAIEALQLLRDEAARYRPA